MLKITGGVATSGEYPAKLSWWDADENVERLSDEVRYRPAASGVTHAAGDYVVGRFTGPAASDPSKGLYREGAAAPAAAPARPHPDPFDDRLVAAEVYRLRATPAPRAARGGGRGSMPAGPAADARRQALIEEVFGKSQRALERDAKLLVLDPAALAAARAGRIPVRAVEAVAKLEPADQAVLAARLAAGGPSPPWRPMSSVPPAAGGRRPGGPAGR